jgi:hypothetical protein
MKINEIITEARAVNFIDADNDGLPDSHQTATPGLRKHTKLDNSSPYHPWRFGAHFLSGADGKNPYEHEPNRDGPIGQALVTIAYTKEEQAMIDQAEKQFGWEAGHTLMTPDGSTEVKTVNKSSVVRKVGPIGLRSKKK